LAKITAMFALVSDAYKSVASSVVDFMKSD
jgi:hypothetical protein